jgi:hypothetical protein
MKLKLSIENLDRPGEIASISLDLNKIKREKKPPFWKTGSSKANIEITIELLEEEK